MSKLSASAAYTHSYRDEETLLRLSRDSDDDCGADEKGTYAADQNDSDTSGLRRCVSTGPVFMIALIVSCSLVYSVKVLAPTSELHSTVLKSSSGHISATSTGSTFLSLQRSGYDPLPYFTAGAPSITQYEFLKDAVAVIEPNADMNLYVSDYGDTSGTYFTYKVCEQSATGATKASSCVSGTLSNNDVTETASVNVGCTPFAKYSLVATEVNEATGESVRSLKGDAVCMYVRREIRDLTESDLAKTMDAMYALWGTDEETGQKQYGEKFHNAAYCKTPFVFLFYSDVLKFIVAVAEAHHFNAAWQDGDHIHEGLGFLPQHLKLTNMFELSMQSVDPSVSLPYWDFTIEGSKDQDVFSSPVFAEETFGSLPEPTDYTLGWTYE
jgi:hypothetical protein